MRVSVWAAVAWVALIAFWALSSAMAPAGAERRTPGGIQDASSWTVMGTPVSGGGQQVVLVDQAARKLVVYQVGANGEISLKGVRNITWDLELDQFNGTRPTPDEIRAMLPAGYPTTP